MKILIINHPYTYQTPWLQITEPLGILYLASYLREYSTHEVVILDCLDNQSVSKIENRKYWYGINYEQMIEKITAHLPDVIGITCMFSKKKDDFLECIRVIRNHFPTAKIVAGGTYPSLFPEEVIQTGLVDYCVIGEGEKTFLQLMDALKNEGTPPADLDGIAYMKNGDYVLKPKQNYIEELDSIPFPARDLINYEAYITRKSVLHGLGLKRSASILTSRSCPNRCNFCSMYRVHGPRWRGRSATNVIAEIVYLVKEFGISNLFVMDDNFTFKRDRIVEICNGIIRSDLKISWNTPNGISINTLDEELLRLMKKSGCKSICIAIETGDEELRNKVIGKRLSDSKIEEVTRSAAKEGIFVTAFYIIGMPGETAEKFKRTLHQIVSLPLNGVAASFANPLPGTKLFQDCIENGWSILGRDAMRDNVLYQPFIVTEDFSEEELIRREKEFYRTFIRAKLFTIIKDTLLMRNLLLYPPFLLRIVKDRLFRH
jgi:magnesium-protoporphyrin IX monomethyl ester (oxidative) cyclase